MARWDDSFNDRHLTLIFTALMQWNELIKINLLNECISEKEKKRKRKFSEELTELIQEIRKEMYRREI